jgi:hypothetical protein
MWDTTRVLPSWSKFGRAIAINACALVLVFASQDSLAGGPKSLTIYLAGIQVNQPHGESPSSLTYLALVVKLGPCSSCVSIEKATQVPGRLVTRNVRSSMIYEITKKGESFFVGFLPDDPLLVRGFSLPSKRDESISRAESATIPIYIPNADLKMAMEGRLGLKIFVARSGCCIEHAGADELKVLRNADKVSLEWQLSESDFASQVKRATAR